MKLTLIRKTFTEKSTIGELYINEAFFCYVLEDKDGGLKDSMDIKEIQRLKLYGVTAIPTGTYKLDLTMSNRFKRVLPILYNVKGYEGVRIHRGNTAEDSLGCLIVGYKKDIDKVYQSKEAEADLVAKLDKHPLNEPITITIQ